jgi:hypothetical protein
MKKTLLVLCTAASFGLSAQTISTFDNIVLPADSFWDGRYDLAAGGFTSGNAFFQNHYDTSYHYWSAGFLVSNKTDSSTSSATSAYNKLTTAITGTGRASANYAIGTQLAGIRINAASAGKQLDGAWITNSNYTWLSMKYGDFVAKSFGGTTGTDPDYLLLTVYGFLNNSRNADSVNFYLADFRSSDPAQDYMLSAWTWLDLQPLGDVDSLSFILTSTDNDSLYGMNTPAYFAIDDFTARDMFTSVQEHTTATQFNVYPNPAAGIIYAEGVESRLLEVFDRTGRMVPITVMADGLDISEVPAGIYLVRNKQTGMVQKIIKN